MPPLNVQVQCGAWTQRPSCPAAVDVHPLCPSPVLDLDSGFVQVPCPRSAYPYRPCNEERKLINNETNYLLFGSDIELLIETTQYRNTDRSCGNFTFN